MANNSVTIPTPEVPTAVQGPISPTEGPLFALMQSTGYPIVQENGQRRFGPPPDWDESTGPPRGCEVFVGKIPRDCFEDELVPILEKAGKLYEVRLMMDFNGANRGYCFVTYTVRADAKRAVRELNDFEIRNRRFLGVCLSVDNCRLFVGGIPRDKQGTEIRDEMKKVADGVVNAIVYPSVADKTKNRGFAFVEFESHRAAAMARRKLLPGRVQLWGQPIAVDWAEPEQEVDEDVMSKVRILYVRNLMLSTKEETIENLFNEAAGKDSGYVERVKKLKDYAFVHFRERADALHALEKLNGADVEGSKIEVVLAKPVERDNITSYPRSNTKPPQLVTNGNGALSFVPPYNHGAHGATYPQQGATNGLSLQTVNTRGLPSIPVREGNPPANSFGPMYPGKGRSAAGSRGAGGFSRGYSARSGNGSNTGYRPVSSEERLYELHPDMELIPTNPHTLKPQRSPIQTLDELCQKNGWGSPAYQLFQAIGHDNITGGDVQLFVFKVFINCITPNMFISNKLCRSVDEAKRIAADNVLAQLGVSQGIFTYPAYSTQAVPATYTYG